MSKPHRRATVTVAPTTAQRGNGGIQQLGRDSTPNPEHRRRACPHGDPVSPRRGWRVAMGHDAVKACQECLTSCQASLTRDCAASSHPSHFCNTPPPIPGWCVHSSWWRCTRTRTRTLAHMQWNARWLRGLLGLRKGVTSAPLASRASWLAGSC